MKFHHTYWLAAAAASFFPGSVDAAGGLRSADHPDRRLQGNGNGNGNGNKKSCVILLKKIHFDDNTEKDEIDCYADMKYNRLSADLEEKVKKDMKEGKVKSGTTVLNVDGSYDINGDGRRVLHVSDVDSITYEDFVPNYGHGRRLATTGTKNMLAIRVVAADASTFSSSAQISDSWFGTDGDAINLRSQYAACSYGALTCNAASMTTSTGVDVTDGVYEVTISENVLGVDRSVIANAVATAGDAALGNMESQFDHVMLCLPSGTSGSWIAYAYVNWYLSVYNNNWCNYVSAQMHEIGHNIGLAHSGEDSDSYGDRTGMMGYSYNYDDGPDMCFNAPKNWQLGWYPLGELEVVNQYFEGKIFGIADYGAFINGDLNVSNGEIIMAKLIDSAAGEDWYVSFNRDTGINSGTVEGQDQVLVHKRPQGTGYAASSLIAKLSTGGVYNGIIIDGIAVPVSVSSINTSSGVGYAQVKIGNAPTTTNSPTKAPVTESPTNPPTHSPTKAPVTLSPTKSPTTAAPTPLPTPEPTESPTTAAPTQSPTTAAPTIPYDCTKHTAKRDCDNVQPTGTCVWTGKNWKSGSCVAANGPAPTPPPPTPTAPSPSPPPTDPSPTPPDDPTPTPPTGGCDVCSATGKECCGTCTEKGNPANRGCS